MDIRHLYARGLAVITALSLIFNLAPSLIKANVAHASDNVWTAQFWNVNSDGPFNIPEAAPDYEDIIPGGALPNYFLGEASPVPGIINPDNFVGRFTAGINVTPGTYTFRTLSDDGVRLYIDSELVIDDWNDQGDAFNTYTVTFAESFHDVVMETYDHNSNATIHLDMHLASDIGDGSAETPFLIHDCNELQAISGASDANYKLANDIDCSVTSAWHDRGEGPEGFDPVSLDSVDFNGDGHTISNLFIDNYDGGNTGLFDTIYYSNVHDFTLLDFDIHAQDDKIGSLAGQVIGDSTVQNIALIGSLNNGQNEMGGAIGYIDTNSHTTTIDNVDTNMTLTALFQVAVGGLIGAVDNNYGQLEVKNCDVSEDAETIVYMYGGLIGYSGTVGPGLTTIHDNTVDVAMNSNGVPNVGGLVGYLNANNGGADLETINIFNNTVTSGSIVGSEFTGGLLGFLDIVDESESTAGTEVNMHNNTISPSTAIESDGDNVGGLIGRAELYAKQQGNIEFNLSQNAQHGDVTGTSYSGGLIGGYLSENTGSIDQTINTTIEQNFVTGDVSATDGNDAGGLIGNIESTGLTSSLSITNSYANSKVSADGNVGGMVGRISTFDDTSLNINNSYAYGTVTENSLDGTGVAGGLIGAAEEGSTLALTNSFAFNQIGNGVINKGSILGSNYTGLGIDNVYYDGALNALTCTSSGNDDYETCDSVSAGDGYFMSAALAPLDGWDFSTIWREESMATPTLRFVTDVPEVQHHQTFIPSTSSTEYTTESQQEWLAKLNPINGSGIENITETPAPVPAPTPSPVPPTTPIAIASHHFDDQKGHEVAADSDKTAPSPYTAMQEPVSSVAAGWYIRGEHYDTVYLVTADGQRRPFWDAKTFMTYTSDWNRVIWVTDATLSTLKPGEPMLPKAGVVLVKIQGEASVYATTSESDTITLHRVPDEATAKTVFGPDWADYVIDLEPTIFYHYVSGPDLKASDVYDHGITKKRVDLH